MTTPTDRSAWWKNTRGEWYVVFQMVLFALILIGPGGIDLHPELSTFWRVVTVVVGFVLGAMGLLMALAGVFSLGDNLSVLPHPKDSAEMVESGPYRLVRHPIYSGLIIGAVGWAVLNVSLLTFIYALALLVFFDIKSRREERYLARKFPGYEAYKSRVRKLIPYLY